MDIGRDLGIDSTILARLAQSTVMEIELNRLVQLVNRIPELEKRIEELEEMSGSCDCENPLMDQLIDHVAFRNGTMILERTKLE